MIDAAVITAVLGFAGTIGGILITAWFGRRQVKAQADHITATAHSLIYNEYNSLITALRTDAQIAREEARGAKETARLAEQRSDAAEEMAYQADSRMQSMERLLVDLRPFLERVPGSEAFLAQIERLTQQRHR
jgi:outer membrane murein-binding lipoprotein Lpp